MRDEFRGLPGEDKVLASLGSPGPDGIQARGPVEDAIQFGGGELTGVVVKLVLEWKSLWKERTAPGIVVPSRRADQNACYIFIRRSSPAFTN